jgi:hypothetical protein
MPTVPPVVPVSVVAHHNFWQLTIEECPHCGKTHTHGGGDLASPPFGGHRISHCYGPSNPGYILELPSTTNEPTSPNANG